MQYLANREQIDLIKLSEYATKLTVATAKEGVPLAIIKKQDPAKAIKAVSDAILWLQNSLNINSPMNNTQIIDASITIVNEYYWLRFEEVVMIIFRIKTGKTEKLYHAFDVRVLCSIIEDYLKSEEVAYFHEQQAKTYKEEEKAINKMPYSEKSAEMLKEIYKRVIEDTVVLEQKSNEHKKIQVREEDYFSELTKLLPTLSEKQLSALKINYDGQNYRDGVNAVMKEMEKRVQML